MGNVTDLQLERLKRIAKQDIAEGKNKLYIHNNKGYSAESLINGNDKLNDKLQRVRDSLEKIHRLMNELKKIGEREIK